MLKLELIHNWNLYCKQGTFFNFLKQKPTPVWVTLNFCFNRTQNNKERHRIVFLPGSGCLIPFQACPIESISYRAVYINLKNSCLCTELVKKIFSGINVGSISISVKTIHTLSHCNCEVQKINKRFSTNSNSFQVGAVQFFIIYFNAGKLRFWFRLVIFILLTITIFKVKSISYAGYNNGHNFPAFMG